MFELLIAFASLSSTPAAATAQPVAAPRRDEIVCRRIRETGSRVASSRVCMTAAEWALEDRENRELWERNLRGPRLNH